MCENAHTQLDPQLGQKLQWWSIVRWGIPIKPTPALGCAIQLKNYTSTFGVINDHVNEWILYLLSPWVFTQSFSISLSLHIFRKRTEFLATSPNYFWKWINACKELCDSWMEGSIGTEIIIKLLNSAAGFTQSAANNCVLCFQAEQHTLPTKGTDMTHICALKAVWKKSNQQPANFIRFRRLFEETENSSVVLWGHESTESHLPWPITKILGRGEYCCFIQHRKLNWILTLLCDGTAQWSHSSLCETLGRLALFYLPDMIFYEVSSSRLGERCHLQVFRIASWLSAIQSNCGCYGKVQSQMFAALIYHSQIIINVWGQVATKVLSKSSSWCSFCSQLPMMLSTLLWSELMFGSVQR